MKIREKIIEFQKKPKKIDFKFFPLKLIKYII